MITLSNGDKWIIDDKEIKGLNVFGGELPAETPTNDFLNQLIYGKSFPRKLIKFPIPGESFGKPYWDSNFSSYLEILTDFAEKVIVTPFCEVLVMPEGLVHVYYTGPDCGGYDCETKRETYNSWQEYANAVLGE